MPTYTYKCTACDEMIEKRQSFSDPPLTTCEQCGGALRKVIHPVGIVFKGTGWYITDSRSSSASSSSSSNGRSSTPSSGESESSGTKSSESTTKASKSETASSSESASKSTSSAPAAKSD